MKQIIFFLVIFLTTPAFAGLPDTGQTKCYGSWWEITCPQPGELCYGQDSQYGPNLHSYTKLGYGGVELPNNATEWLMIKDNVTGLIWENRTDDGSICYYGDYFGNEAQDVFIPQLNRDYYGGYFDWRLPTVKELSTLVDSNTPGWAINTDYFPNTQVTEAYMPGYASSTPFAEDAYGYLIWTVYFYQAPHNFNSVSAFDKFEDCFPVRAVRAGQSWLFENSFIDNGDGTVSDINTGLMWQQATAPSTNSRCQALAYCENLTLAGYDDWRLPNRNELQSLVDYNRLNPAIDTGFFPDTMASGYWSSTQHAQDPQYLPYDPCTGGWYVHFGSGAIYGVIINWDTVYISYYIRAVRGGLCGLLSDADRDTVCDDADNCPNDYNPHQQDCDGDGIGDVCDPDTIDADGDGIDQACDNCPTVYNPNQEDADADGIGDACDPSPDNDLDDDGILDAVDNCPAASNSPDKGTCVNITGGVLMGTGVICYGLEDCNEDELCDMDQLDINANGIGDACECYADCNHDGKVNTTDLGIMKTEFFRTNCATVPCRADIDNDNKVNTSDLGIMKTEFFRTNCFQY